MVLRCALRRVGCHRHPPVTLLTLLICLSESERFSKPADWPYTLLMPFSWIGRWMLTLSLLGAVVAQHSPRALDAQASDPVRMGWMQGYPPPPYKVVRWSADDHMSFPKNRWALSHLQQMMPTKTVRRGARAIREMPVSLEHILEIDGISYGSGNSRPHLGAISAGESHG